jgi:acyl carrier protein
MDKTKFLIELEDVLQRPAPCAPDDVLADYEEWDSLSKMAVMAFFDQKFDVKMTLADIQNLKTVNDLIAKAGVK